MDRTTIAELLRTERPSRWTASQLADALMAGPQAAASIGSGMLAQPISGLAGLFGLGGGPERAANAVGRVQDMLTYRPTNPYAQRVLSGVSEVTAPIGKAFEALRQKAGDAGYAVGGPLGGAIGSALPDAAAMALPFAGRLARNAQIPATLSKERGIFAGVGAKTADLSKFEEAQRLAKSGATPDDIWNKTGWFQGADKKWRFEIDDSAATYAPGREFSKVSEFANSNADSLEHAAILRSYMETNGASVGAAKEWFAKQFGRQPHEWAGQMAKDTPQPELLAMLGKAEQAIPKRSNWNSRVGNVLEHNPLYQSYPQMDYAGFQVRGIREMNLDNMAGSWDGRNVMIRDDVAPTLQSGKSTLLHELQHAVQDREGFALGGNPEQMAAEWAKAKSKWDFDSTAAALAREAEATAGGNVDKAARMLNEIGIEVTPEHIDQVMRLGKNGAIQRAEQSEAALKQFGQMTRSGGDPGYQLYNRLAGEAEARAVQSRMNLTPEQRRALPPWQSYDVPVEQQIVRFK